jgi:hypothetical protein
MPCLQHQRIARADEFDANHPETDATVIPLHFYFIFCFIFLQQPHPTLLGSCSPYIRSNDLDMTKRKGRVQGFRAALANNWFDFRI